MEKNRVQPGPEPYTFDFGPKELINMVGMSMEEGKSVLQRLFENKKIKVVDNHIFTSDSEDISKQTEYFKKMEKIQKSREEGSLKAQH
jgi:hypothetical protein